MVTVARQQELRCLCLQSNETPQKCLSVDVFNLMQPDYWNSSSGFTWTNTQSAVCLHVKVVNSGQVWLPVPCDSNVSAIVLSVQNCLFFLSLKSVNLSVLFDRNRKSNSGQYEAEKPLKRGIDVQTIVQTMLNSVEKQKVSGTWIINRLLYMLIFWFYLKAHFAVWLYTTINTCTVYSTCNVRISIHRLRINGSSLYLAASFSSLRLV